MVYAKPPGKATQSHPQATYKPTTWEEVATHMRPTSHPHATPMRPSCDHQARKAGGEALCFCRAPMGAAVAPRWPHRVCAWL